MFISENSKRNIILFFKPARWKEWEYETAKSQSDDDYISFLDVLRKYALITNPKAHQDNKLIEADLKKGKDRKNSLVFLVAIHLIALIFSCSCMIIVFLVLLIKPSHIGALISGLVSLIIFSALCRYCAVKIEKLRKIRLDESAPNYLKGERSEKSDLVIQILRDKRPNVFSKERGRIIKIIKNAFWSIDNFLPGLLKGHKGLEIMALSGTPPSGILFERNQIEKIFATFHEDGKEPQVNKFLKLLESIDPEELDPISVNAEKWACSPESSPEQYKLLTNQKKMYDFVVGMVQKHSSLEEPHKTNLKPTRLAILEALCYLIIHFDLWKRLLMGVALYK